MKDIYIIGAGGFAREVAWLIDEINKKHEKWNFCGFIDENVKNHGKKLNGYNVLGGIETLADKKNINVVIAIGNPISKMKIVEKLNKIDGITFPVLIDPYTRYSESVEFGEGSIITSGVILTVNIKVGKHVIINIDSTVGHDAVIGDYSTILPSVNISGDTFLGKCSNIGTGSAIIQGIKIGENSIIGAGAVVVKNIPSNCTAVGAPAKPIKFHK